MELSIAHGFVELNDFTLSEINAGGIWGIISGAAQVVAGAGMIIGGVGLLLAPDPSTLSKYAGAAGIAGGLGNIGGGIAVIANSR